MTPDSANPIILHNPESDASRLSRLETQVTAQEVRLIGLLKAQTTHFDNSLHELEKRVEQRFALNDKALIAALQAAKEAVSAALQAAKEAVDKAERSAGERGEATMKLLDTMRMEINELRTSIARSVASDTSTQKHETTSRAEDALKLSASTLRLAIVAVAISFIIGASGIAISLLR